MSPDSADAAIPLAQLAISDHARSLYRDGYARDAVRHESQRLLNRLQTRAALLNMGGQSLIERALSEQDPVLILNPRATALERDEQAGFRHLVIGVTRGVRNVLTHDIDREVSLEDGAIWLGLISLLHQQLDAAYLAEGESDDQGRSESVG